MYGVSSVTARGKLSHGYLQLLGGKNVEEAARIVFEQSPQTLGKSGELLHEANNEGFLS